MNAVLRQIHEQQRETLEILKGRQRVLDQFQRQLDERADQVLTDRRELLEERKKIREAADIIDDAYTQLERVVALSIAIGAVLSAWAITLWGMF